MLLGSGGNDNLIKLWAINYNKPIHTFNAHKGAIKALDWSHHKYNILVTGGGT